MEMELKQYGFVKIILEIKSKDRYYCNFHYVSKQTKKNLKVLPCKWN